MLALLLWLASSSHALALDFGHYHSQEEINAYLADTARQNPDLVHFRMLGYSEQGRETDYVVLASGDPETLPALYLNGTHHGDEKSSTETVLGLIDFLVHHRQQPDVRELLDSYAIYLQPVVNPDGQAASSRYDSLGRDPNRDYSYPERSDEDSFKIPSIKLVKDLADHVRFRAALAFHSGMEGVLWAWAYTPRRAADTDVFYTVAKATAQAMGMPRYLQSYADYPSRGEFIDYMYMSHGTLAMTVEVSSDPAPPVAQLQAVVQRAVGGSMAFMLSVLELDRGELKVEHPTEAQMGRQLLTLRIDDRGFANGQPARPSR
jgi:predicted deacylase